MPLFALSGTRKPERGESGMEFTQELEQWKD